MPRRSKSRARCRSQLRRRAASTRQGSLHDMSSKGVSQAPGGPPLTDFALGLWNQGQHEPQTERLYFGPRWPLFDHPTMPPASQLVLHSDERAGAKLAVLDDKKTWDEQGVTSPPAPRHLQPAAAHIPQPQSWTNASGRQCIKLAWWGNAGWRARLAAHRHRRRG